jgi:hypothetical protein
MKQSGFTGTGCPASVFGLPIHNPEPSTERGKRRFAKLNTQQQEMRRKSWGKNRTSRKSKRQVMMEQAGNRRGV